MLQINKIRPTLNHSTLEPDGSSSLKDLYDAVYGLLRRQYPLILLVLLLTMALGVVYLMTAPVKYTAEAVLIIDTHKVQVFQQQPVVGDFAVVDSATVDTQVEVLKSEGLARAVLKELHLLNDPEFATSKPSFPRRVINFFANIFHFDKQNSEEDPIQRALAVFQNNLTIKRPPGTYIIEIDYISLNADRAAQIANAVADTYIAESFDAKYQATKRATLWLQDRAKELREQVAMADHAVVDYRAKNNIIDTGGAGGKLMNEQQLTELNTQLIQAQAQTAELKARMDRVNEIIRPESSGIAKVEGMVTDAVPNEVITKLRQQYLDLATREGDWSKRYGEQHLAVVNLRNQMREIDHSIMNELQRIAQTYKNDYEVSKSRQEAIKKRLSEIVLQSTATSDAQVILHDLESSAQASHNLYDNFLQRYMESVQQQSFPIAEARVITPAMRPMTSSQPKVPIVAATSLIGGLLLAFGCAILRDNADRMFRTVGQVEAALQLDCIAVVPTIKRPTDRTSSPVTHVRDVLGRRTIVCDRNLSWHVANAPFSRFSEAIRSIKMSADLLEISKSTKVLGVTSSLPNEGKSTIATALALSIAQGQSRVILVDCDLRNPTLTRELTPDAAVGLLDVLSDRTRLEEAVWTDPSTNLIFLPMVMKTRVAHTGDILGAAPTKKLFESLREQYDYVVVDLSPLAPVIDVRATPGFIDSYVYVIEWGRTKIDVVEHALESARGVYGSILGVVLNKVDMNVLRRFEHYHVDYYSDEYHSRYGYPE
jgi:succinoglycan biosynthesis transport protein ExoP